MEPPAYASRACTACTLITDDATRTTCEACGCELDELRPKKKPRSIQSLSLIHI